MNIQILQIIINGFIGVTSLSLGYYQGHKSRQSRILIEDRSELTHFAITFQNLGPVPVPLSSSSGFITPRGKLIEFADEGEGQLCPKLLEPYQSLTQNIRLGFINDCLVNEGYRGQVKIRFFVRNKEKRIFKSKHRDFNAFDIKMIPT